MAKELLGELAANLEYLTLQKPLNSTEAYNEMVTARQASQMHCSIFEILLVKSHEQPQHKLSNHFRGQVLTAKNLLSTLGYTHQVTS